MNLISTSNTYAGGGGDVIIFGAIKNQGVKTITCINFLFTISKILRVFS